MTAFHALVAPSLDDLEKLGIDALASLPPEVRQLTGKTIIRVADFPEEDVLAELKAETEFDILGLFQGIGMAQDSAVPETGRLPNMIWLYRRPILDYWADNDESLGAIVTHVLIHEIGHHFGLSDDDMEALDEAAQNEGADRATH